MDRAATTGEILLEIKRRTKLPLRQIAKLAGYAGASSVQEYFNADYDGQYLPSGVAERLCRALAGKGDPPVTAEEIMALSPYTSAPGSLLLSEPVAAAIVWHLARRLGAEVERDDPEVLKQGRFLAALLKLLVSHQARDGIDWLDGWFAATDLQLPS